MAKIVNWLPLSHNHSPQLNRCVMLPLGQLRVAVCARCLGLYPVMLAALFGQILVGLQPAGTMDWLLVLVGSAPALFDWALGRLNTRQGNNAIRIITGIIAGLALGRSIFLYLRDQRSEVFLVQMFLIAVTVGAVEFVRSLKIR